MPERIQRRDFLKVAAALPFGAAAAYAELEDPWLLIDGGVNKLVTEIEQQGYTISERRVNHADMRFIGVQHVQETYDKNISFFRNAIADADVVIIEDRPIDQTITDKVATNIAPSRGTSFYDSLFDDLIDHKSLVICPDPRHSILPLAVESIPGTAFMLKVGSAIAQKKLSRRDFLEFFPLAMASYYLNFSDTSGVVDVARLHLSEGANRLQAATVGRDDKVVLDRVFHSNFRLAQTINEVTSHPDMIRKNLLVIYGGLHMLPALAMTEEITSFQKFGATLWDQVGVETRAYLPDTNRQWTEVPYLFGEQSR